MKRRPYAGEITKEYLKKLGVEHVSTDGTIVIKKGEQANIVFNEKAKKSYGQVSFYDAELYASVPKEEKRPNTGEIIIGIHVLNYVWNREDKPQGMVIDHIDNNPRNNDISNLQMMTQGENVAKEKSNWHTREIKCQLNKPRSFYETKLEGYQMAYEQAKKDHDAEAAHHFRTNISQTRARLRYYDNHIEEYQAKSIKKKTEHDCHARAAKRRELQANVDRARLFYLQVRDAYGKDDAYVKQMWGEWKLAIAMLQGFKEENKRANRNQLN